MAESEGRVEYEIRADDSKLDSDLSSAQKKVINSEKSASSKRETVEKSTSSTLKHEKKEVANYHEQQNDKIVADDKTSADQRETIEKNVCEKITKGAATTAKVVGASFLAIGASVVAGGVAAVKGANDLDASMNDFIATTGTSVDETEKYQKVLEDIYTNNYGESFEDISDGMSKVKTTLKDLDDQSLQNVTESAFALRDTFEYDIGESTRAAKALMDNFGVSGEEAMSMIAAGAQNGLDYSGEMMDSISEYSVQFSKVGLDADAMFKIFEVGAETGAWNIDKVGDAVKEMSIRVIDGSETTKSGFETIGLNADDMAAKFSAGGASAEEAFSQTLDALASLEDPMEQNAAGVALFGTTWEDLGPEVVTQLASISEGAYDTAGAMEGIKEVKYDDFGSMLEATGRALEMLIIPLGEMLIPLLQQLIEGILPVLEEMIPIFTEMIAALMPFISELISTLLPVLVSLFDALIPPITEIISMILPVLLELFNALLPIFDLLISLLTPIIDLFMQLLAPILELISTAITPLIEIITELIGFVLQPLIAIIGVLGDIFGGVLGGMFDIASGIIGSIVDIFGGLIDFIAGVFTGDWGRVWDGVVGIFKGLISGIVSIFKTPINWIISGINLFIKGLNKLKIPDWVPGIGGLGFHIKEIPKLRVGMDWVPSDDFPALLHKGEAVLTAEENATLRSIGGITGLHTAVNSPSFEGFGLHRNQADEGDSNKQYTFVANLELDGQKVAKATSVYNDQELANIENLKGRGI